MALFELDHSKHRGASFEEDGSDVVTVTDVVMVVFDGSWPASRPDNPHVIAVRGTSAPSWLTAQDIWLEDVS